MELLWIQLEGYVFELAGAFIRPDKQLHIKHCAVSENHTKGNWRLQHELQFVHAKKSETIGQLSVRMGNK